MTHFSQKTNSGRKDIESINLMQLTEAGKIVLSVFTEEIINYSRFALARKMKKEADAGNVMSEEGRYRYFFVVCKKRSQEQGIPLKWGDIHDVLKEKGLSYESPRVKEEEV